MGAVQSTDSEQSTVVPSNYISVTEAQLLIDKQNALISNLQTTITNINNSLIVDAQTNQTPTTIPMVQLPRTTPTTTTTPITTTPSTTTPSTTTQSITPSTTTPSTTPANRFQNIGSSKIHEGFAIGSLPNNNIPELKDYVTAYNESVALLDDPNNLNQLNFDTYIHLQDKKLAELNKLITDIQTTQKENGNQNKPIKAIRNLNTSTILNVEEYSDSTNGNGAVNYPNYLVYGNNGCLQYNIGTSKQNPSSYSFQPCNANNANQRFTMQQIRNKDDYNARISDPTKQINNDDTVIMGFYVVNPEVDQNQCITLNNSGLTVEPCDMYASQRFKPYYHSVNP